MSLRTILLDVASDLGLDLSNADELAYHIAKVNDAAKEVYDTVDLPGCLREQIFQVDDTDNYQVAFPYYVHKIRAIRFYNTIGGKISIQDMRPRYHTNRWGAQESIKYIIKQQNAALCKNITNVAPLIFSLPDDVEENAAIVINIVGKTPSSARILESVTILAGETSVQTDNHFEEVESIEKTALNNYDIGITSIDGEELGDIPNAELRSNYTIVKIREDDLSLAVNNSYSLNTIEVLYKTKFIPFFNNFDEFPAPDCDKLISWKFMEHYWSRKPGHAEESLLANGKFKEVLKTLITNDNIGKEMSPDRKKNRMFAAQEKQHNLCFVNDPPQIGYPSE